MWDAAPLTTTPLGNREGDDCVLQPLRLARRQPVAFAALPVAAASVIVAAPKDAMPQAGDSPGAKLPPSLPVTAGADTTCLPAATSRGCSGFTDPMQDAVTFKLKARQEPAISKEACLDAFEELEQKLRILDLQRHMCQVRCEEFLKELEASFPIAGDSEADAGPIPPTLAPACGSGPLPTSTSALSTSPGSRDGQLMSWSSLSPRQRRGAHSSKGLGSRRRRVPHARSLRRGREVHSSETHIHWQPCLEAATSPPASLTVGGGQRRIAMDRRSMTVRECRSTEGSGVAPVFLPRGRDLAQQLACNDCESWRYSPFYDEPLPALSRLGRRPQQQQQQNPKP